MSTTEPPRHAVVVGAGIAGLAAARALRAVYPEVTLLERDRLPAADASPRRRGGVPQGPQVHLLQAAGVHQLEALFPGAVDELAADGAVVTTTDRARLCFGGHRLARDPAAGTAVLATRPRLEATLRRWVTTDPGVRLRDQHVAQRVCVSGDGRRITGVEVAAADPATAAGDRPHVLPAALVLDATGRRGPTLRWLEELGVDPPSVDELRIDVSYATCRYRLPADALGGDRLVAVGPTADRPCGGVVCAVEDDQWLITLYGLAGVPAPRSRDDFATFAWDLAVPDVAEAIAVGQPQGEPASYRFPADRWRRLDRLRGLPDGLLATGDAVCTYNPIYGQGMAVALLEAVRLRRLLTRTAVPEPRRWYRAIRPVVADTWQLATGADLSVDAVPGPRPTSVRLLNRYVARLQQRATSDPALTEAFVRIIGLVDRPQRMLHPRTAARVLRPATA